MVGYKIQKIEKQCWKVHCMLEHSIEMHNQKKERKYSTFSGASRNHEMKIIMYRHFFVSLCGFVDLLFFCRFPCSFQTNSVCVSIKNMLYSLVGNMQCCLACIIYPYIRLSVILMFYHEILVSSITLE